MQEQIFKFGSIELIGLVDNNDEWYFHGSVVCMGCKLISDSSNASKYIKDHVPSKWRRVIRGSTGRGAYYVTEPGLYKLILTATSTEGIEFSDWVVEDVLPSIRKKAYYYDHQVLTENREKLEVAEAELGSLRNQLEISEQLNFQMRSYIDTELPNIKTKAIAIAKEQVEEEVKTAAKVEFQCYTDAENGDPIVYIEQLKRERDRLVNEKKELLLPPSLDATKLSQDDIKKLIAERNMLSKQSENGWKRVKEEEKLNIKYRKALDEIKSDALSASKSNTLRRKIIDTLASVFQF